MQLASSELVFFAAEGSELPPSDLAQSLTGQYWDHSLQATSMPAPGRHVPLHSSDSARLQVRVVHQGDHSGSQCANWVSTPTLLYDVPGGWLLLPVHTLAACSSMT